MAEQSSSPRSDHGLGEVAGLGMRVHLPIVVTVSDDCDQLVPCSFQMPRGELGFSSEPPGALERLRDAFARLLTKAVALGLDPTSRVKFTIGTMFSGSDAPVLALRELRDAAIAQGHPALLDFDHEFSVEIEKYKAAFIGRNSKPRGHIYRNAIDLADPDKRTAMTADGSMAPIPEAPDLLVAGSSCVDFSKQNSRRNPLWAASILNQTWQEFKASEKAEPRPPSARREVVEFFEKQRVALRQGGQGESTLTFVALIQYIYHKRPKVVLLENVAGAPWKQFSNFWMPFVGYVAEFVKVDSKDFLVPQTRNRGYLVAVDHWHYGQKSQSVAELWAQLMRGSNWFENCHPPIHTFLLAPDDPRILEARFVDERRVAENLTRDPEARMCSYDHAKVRRERDLGPTHPYTRLDARGNVTPRDTAWRAFLQSQGTRVLDLLDIVFLQARKEGMDLEHKTKTLDLGQGVERMNGKLGIAGCILPDANLFLTDQGRPVLGAEALMLQAIPLDRVRISVETQRELHDLAGNAMTATVVGAAMLAVVIAERQVMGEEESALKGSHDEDEADIIRRLPVLSRRQEHNGGRSIHPARMETSLHFTTTKRVFVKVGDLLRIHALGRRYCPCGGFRKHHPAKGLKKCVICGEIRCNECAGNPSHDFVEFLLEHDVCSTDETTAALYKLLPGRFRLARDNIRSVDHFDTQRILRDLVGDADSSMNADVLRMLLKNLCATLDSVFYLTRINIGQVITATYMSRCSRIDLVIEDECIHWQLFLLAGSDAAEEIQEKMAWNPRVPIARAVIADPELGFLPETEDWDIFWSRGDDIITLTFSPTDDQGLACIVEAYNHRQLAEWRHDPWVSSLVETLRGQFTRTTCCGTPMGILYARLNDTSRQRPLYAFKDVGRVTSPEQDHWVMARSARKVDPDEYRDILWFKAFLARPDFGSPKRRGLRIAQFPPTVLQPISFAFEEMHVGYGLERSFPDVGQGLFPLMQLRLPIPDMPFPVPLLPRLWNTNGQAFKCLAKQRDDSGTWLRVQEDLHRDTLRVVEFATRMTGPHFFPREIRRGILVECEQTTLEQLDAGYQKPKLFRVWESAKFVEMFEDPAALPQYVDALDKRPLPLELDVQLVEAGGKRLAGDLYSVRPDFESLVYPELLMRFLVNPTALAHEAWQHLPIHGAEKAKVLRRERVQRLGFRVEFGFVDPSLKNLAPFRRHLLAGSSSYCSDLEQQHMLTPSFAKNNMRLRPDQTKAVLWMAQQESPAASFIETESAEYLISDTIRMRAHAEVTNHARGGVLAHDVGYGKTVVTLGLIDYQTMRNPHGTVEERLSWTEHGHHHLGASLIICPPQIVRQWELEAKKFLGSGWKVLTIQSATKILRANLERADIVIVSSSVIEDLKGLRKLAALVGERESHVRDLPERVFDEWYRDCLDRLRLHRQTWEEDGYVEAAHEIRELQQLRDKELQQAQEKRVPDSSRKAQKTTMESCPRRNTTGSGRQQQAEEKEEDKEEEDSSPKLHPRKLPCTVTTDEVRCAFEMGTLLQLYTFERVVMDEFSYENKFVSAFVKNAVAGSKWILSGTPPVANLAQVCAMGELINMHIARYEPSVPSWFPAITKGPRPDYLTKSESLRSYGVPKTAQFALERHHQACHFLEEKVRQQETDTSHIKTTEQAVVCYLDPISAVVYYQFHRRLRDANWDTEDVPDELKPIMLSLLRGAGVSSAQRHNRARDNLRTTWRNTIQALLAQASLNLAPFAGGLQGMGLEVSWDGGNAVDLITQSVWSVYEREITRYKRMLKSQFDMTMYLLAVALRDAENPEIRLTQTQNAKRETYIDHWNDMLQEIRTARMPAERLGDDQIRAVLFDVVAPRTGPCAEAGEDGGDFWNPELWAPWYGGRGIHTPLDWWDLTDDDLATMPDVELRYLKAVLTQLDACHNNNRDPTPAQGEERSEEAEQSEGKEDLVATVNTLLKTDAMKRHRDANKDEVADVVGLKNKGCMAAYWADKTRAKDFMFGSRLYPSRPMSGGEISERGVQQDQVINHFQMAVQNVGDGIRKFVQSYRNLRVVMRIIELLSRGTPDARRIDCDKCKEEITSVVPLDQVHLFMACGHILCHGCARAYGSCETTWSATSSSASAAAAAAAGGAKKCAAPSCGSMDGDSLVCTDEIITGSGMDTNEMITLRGPSAKVRKIVETIQNEVVEHGEKALIFVGFQSLKTQLFEALQDAGLEVYMTTGAPQDGAVIERFKQQAKDGASATTRILIQSILTSESAGTNLPEVNHVMFASPLHTDTESYYAYHRQAIGRAKRAGQTRTVNIYHFVTAHTMEVEVLEHRLGYPLYFSSHSDRVPIDVQRRDEHERRLLFGNTSGRARNGGRPGSGRSATAPSHFCSHSGDETGISQRKRILSHIGRQDVRKLLHSQEYHEFLDELDI